MTPADYYDWWFFSGICPGIPTRPANHAELCRQLSAPGVHLVVLGELLRENEGAADTAYAGYQWIAGAAERIAAAAHAVGAERLAAWMSALPDAPVAPETHPELKRLLKKYAAQHKAVLMADIASLGDPRAASGFDRRQVRRERDARHGENNGRYQISDRVPLFAAPLAELRSYLEQGMTLAEIGRQNDNMAGLSCWLRYDLPRWASEPQPPDVVAFLEQCRQLFEQYPLQLPPWGNNG